MTDDATANTPIDETDLAGVKLEVFRVQSRTLAKRFARRRINFHGCETMSDAQRKVKELVLAFRTQDSTTRVGFGDSVTLHQLDVFRIVEMIPNLEVIDPMKRQPDGKYVVFGKQAPGRLDLPLDEYHSLMGKLVDRMRACLDSDIFIIGANAITMKGQIVSTDGTGNRVGGMVFGPRKVIIVVGRNKIVEDVDAAIKRNRNVAAPLNFFRHNEKHHNRFDTPCMKLGYCTECNSERRGCLNTVIVDGAIELFKDRLHVVLVNEDLGF